MVVVPHAEPEFLNPKGRPIHCKFDSDAIIATVN